MSRRIRVGILFGGRSAEHEVSLQSARNVVEALDRDKYEPVLIGIDKQGRWFLDRAAAYLLGGPEAPRAIARVDEDANVLLVPREDGSHLVREHDHAHLGTVDVVFPVLHGTYGEDGTIQGLLKLANLPFVGAGVLGSAVGMDKDVMKRLLRDAGLPIARFLVLDRARGAAASFDTFRRALGTPLFVKPANLGSSVGVSRVEDEAGLASALDEAFRYDTKVLVEERIGGREIECSVLGDEDPIASVPGEIVPRHAFYSYEAKYLDADGAELRIPAELPDATVERVQALAVAAFRTLCCAGMARVDFFLRGEDEVLVNEINTIPGFTRISMYPKLWEASGIPYPELIDRLVRLAIERFEREQRLATSFLPEG